MQLVDDILSAYAFEIALTGEHSDAGDGAEDTGRQANDAGVRCTVDHRRDGERRILEREIRDSAGAERCQGK